MTYYDEFKALGEEDGFEPEAEEDFDGKLGDLEDEPEAY